MIARDQPVVSTKISANFHTGLTETQNVVSLRIILVRIRKTGLSVYEDFFC